MKEISVTDEKRVGKEKIRSLDMAIYSKKRFGMFDGEETEVQLLCANRMAGVMIDCFGKSTPFIKKDDEHFIVLVSVAISVQFLGWVMALGDGVRIVGSEAVVERMEDEVRRLSEAYLKE